MRALLASLSAIALLALVSLGYTKALHDIKISPFPFDLFLVALCIALLPLKPREWGVGNGFYTGRRYSYLSGCF